MKNNKNKFTIEKPKIRRSTAKPGGPMKNRKKENEKKLARKKVDIVND